MTIVVGVDGSGPSRAALAWALRRATDVGAPVALVHVVDDEWGQLGAGYADVEEADAARVLDEAMDHALELSPNLEVTSRMVHGSTAWSLTDGLAPDDLIVIGTHKTGYLRGRVIGTRSIVVASVAPCSVAVIPDVDLRGRRGIVIGVADGPAWPAAVRAGGNEAVRTGQELALVHAATNRPAVSSVPGRELLAAAAALGRSIAPETVIRSRVSRRQPADALLDASHAASLLVLGSSRRDPGRAGFIGSVIHDVLLNINAPVLIALGTESPTVIAE